jgi:hypothetical protein
MVKRAVSTSPALSTRIQYNSTTLKGAMVALPNGAASLDLRNKGKIHNLAFRCGLSWYKYANVDQGRMAPNGSLYVVTGCDKANAFQMASWSHDANEGEISVTFTAAELAEGIVSYSFTGETYSPVDVRVGPRSPSWRQNQCIFLRGFKVAVREMPLALVKEAISLTDIIGAKRRQILPSEGGGVPYGDNRRWPSSRSRNGSGSSSGSSPSSQGPSTFDSTGDDSDDTSDGDASADTVSAEAEARSFLPRISLNAEVPPLALSSIETLTGLATCFCMLTRPQLSHSK